MRLGGVCELMYVCMSRRGSTPLHSLTQQTDTTPRARTLHEPPPRVLDRRGQGAHGHGGRAGGLGDGPQVLERQLLHLGALKVPHDGDLCRFVG